MGPGTYLTSISWSSPGFLSARIFLYLIFLTRYFLTSPSFLRILPIARALMWMSSFPSCQCILSAHFFVFFLISIILSLIRIDVSMRYVLGSVDLGMSPASPCFFHALTHRSRLRLLYGQTFSASTSFTSFLTTGRTHRRRSSLIVLAIHIAISLL